MNKELRLLYVEDDKDNRESLVNLLSDDTIGDYTIKIDGFDSFDGAFEEITAHKYHIIILDLFLGNPRDQGKEIGIDILQAIQEKYFVPVIFFSGNTKNVEDLKSQIVGVVTKGDDGFDGLRSEIERLIKFNLPFIKENLHNHIETELKTYFWDIIHSQRAKFRAEDNDFSLGYLMLRKFGQSLTKNKISEILGDGTLNVDKAHPMQFYIYPTDLKNEFDSGEILEKDGEVYVVLTPSCDFISSGDRIRKVGKVLLVKTVLLTQMPEYKKYEGNKEKFKQSLSSLIESRKGDRYFFLPKTPFIENRVLDFQIKEMYDYEKLKDFSRITKLDSPFSEAAVSSFIRYYNRIGYPDIDSEHIIGNL